MYGIFDLTKYGGYSNVPSKSRFGLQYILAVQINNLEEFYQTRNFFLAGEKGGGGWNTEAISFFRSKYPGCEEERQPEKCCNFFHLFFGKGRLAKIGMLL